MKDPDGVIQICSDAFFYSCDRITSVTIPKSVGRIADHTFGYEEDFENGGYIKREDFMIYCYAGTVGEEYALQNGFLYKMIN